MASSRAMDKAAPGMLHRAVAVGFWSEILKLGKSLGSDLRAKRFDLRPIIAASAMAVVGILSATSDASAITWTLTNVPLTDGGTLSGTFSINQYGYLGDYNLTTTFGGLGFSETYFSPPPVAANINTAFPPTAGNVVTFFPNDAAATGALQLTFANSLSTPGIDFITIGNADRLNALARFHANSPA